jgi:hypothetical protein
MRQYLQNKILHTCEVVQFTKIVFVSYGPGGRRPSWRPNGLMEHATATSKRVARRPVANK